ncbi:MAG: helix-turn-helix domain-containing protein, partial [Tepidisphaeraceae bacterium]
MDSIGTRIRLARRERGWTLDALAERAGMSKPYLSLIENER